MRTEWRASSSSRRAAPAATSSPASRSRTCSGPATPQVHVVFVGTPRGLEGRLVPAAGYPLELLPILPLNAVGFGRTLRGLLALPRAFVRAFRLLRRLRPEAVLGVGGYAGGPDRAPRRSPAGAHGDPRAQCPARLHEPRPPALRGPRRLRLRGDAPSLRQEGCRDRQSRARGLRPDRAPRAPPAAAPPGLRRQPGLTAAQPRPRRGAAASPRGPTVLRIVHQTGEAERADVGAAYAASQREAEVLAFLDDMPTRFAEADLVVSRSGATTCAELAAAGRAAILVPFALAADDHQRQNAGALEAAGAARMIEEKDLTGPGLAETLRDLWGRRSGSRAWKRRRVAWLAPTPPPGWPISWKVSLEPDRPRGRACLGRSSTSTSWASAASA